MLPDKQADSGQKVPQLLSRIDSPRIIVMDGFEALLDSDDEFISAELVEFIDAIIELDHRTKVIDPSRSGAGTFGVSVGLRRLDRL